MCVLAITIPILLVTSIFYKWVGFITFFVGVVFWLYALAIKAQNAVLHDVNKRLIEQVSSMSERVGDTAIRIKILTEYITKLQEQLINETQNEAESNTTDNS